MIRAIGFHVLLCDILYYFLHTQRKGVAHLQRGGAIPGHCLPPGQGAKKVAPMQQLYRSHHAGRSGLPVLAFDGVILRATLIGRTTLPLATKVSTRSATGSALAVDRLADLVKGLFQGFS